MNTSLLKDYIKRVYELEVSLYKQRTLQEKIRNEISYYSNLRPEALKKLNDTKFSIDKLLETLFCVLGAGITFVGILLLGSMILTVIGIFLEIFGCYVLHNFLNSEINFKIIIGILIFVMVIALIIKINSYKNTINKNKIIEKDNNEIVRKNIKNKEIANKKIAILNQELTKLTSLYKETKATLDIYYDKNIVFPKYRNLFAISSYLDYLSSVRCSCLEGHEGAYNIFEDEILHKIIIRKLDEVIEHLENIESNQYMLYSAIKESDRETNRIGQELNRVSQRIEENTYVTAYNSNIAAQNTEFLKWVELLR